MLEVKTQQQFNTIFWDEYLFCKELNINYDAFKLNRLFTQATGLHMPTYQEIYNEKTTGQVVLYDEHNTSKTVTEINDHGKTIIDGITYNNPDGLPYQFLFNHEIIKHNPGFIKINGGKYNSDKYTFMKYIYNLYGKDDIYNEIYEQSDSIAEAYNAIKFINSDEFKFRDNQDMLHVFFNYNDVIEELHLTREEFIKAAIKYPDMQILYNNVVKDKQ